MPVKSTVARGRALGTALLAAATLTVAPTGPVTAAEPTPGRLTGALTDGVEWVIDVPPSFNGTLLLYRHGLAFPGEDNPAVDAPDRTTAQALLDRGYALAGSSFGTGFAVQEALRDQSELLDVFAGRIRPPARTIAWGTSLGGLISGELLERNPDRISGAVPMCGLMAGGAGVFNTYLDLMFVVRTLIAPSIVLTGDPDPFGTVGTLLAALAQAQETRRVAPGSRWQPPWRTCRAGPERARRVLTRTTTRPKNSANFTACRNWW